MSRALRFEVLQALEQARRRVAHGAPTLHAALHYLRLTDRGWVEVDKALDDVRFTVTAENLEATAQSQGKDNADGLDLRDDLATCWRNRNLPWESPEGLTRAQAVALCFIAREFLKRLLVVSAGPLLPSLGLEKPRPAPHPPAAPEPEGDAHG